MVQVSSLTRVNAGGGIDHEQIRVHCVALEHVDAWLKQRRLAGLSVDPRTYAALYFLRNPGLT